MKIGVCDDDSGDLQLIYDLLRAYDKGRALEIFCFASAAELYRSEIDFDIAILDIEMPAPNGFEIARQLLQRQNKPLILFLTASTAYSIRGYGVAYRYLVKPVSESVLFPVLDSAIREVRANRFVLSADGACRVFRLEDIYYFEAFNHHVILHTRDSEWTYRSTLKEILTQLPGGCFGMPHQSYLVNFSHVKAASAASVQLTNGVSIPMSRRRQRDFDREFHVYLGR